MKDESFDALIVAIQRTRVEMVEAANKFGYTHNRTVEISQKLDVLLNEYHMRVCHPKRKVYIYRKVKGTYSKAFNKSCQLQLFS
ncbi:MAG: aspartyl-phosphate phosphatase Spo0E family protein [Bacillus sp. (in: firmicutes)]